MDNGPGGTGSCLASGAMRSLRTPASALRRRLRRRLLRHRRLLAATLAALGTWTAVHVAATPPPATITVWTAGTDLPAGHRLDPADLVPHEYAPGTAPDHPVTPDDARGHVLAAPVRAGEPLTDVRMVDTSLRAAYPGYRLVPLRVSDPDVVDLLEIGDLLDVVASSGFGRDRPVTIASEVPLVAIPTPRPGLSRGELPGRLVLVAVPAPESTRVAADALAGVISVAWSR